MKYLMTDDMNTQVPLLGQTFVLCWLKSIRFSYVSSNAIKQKNN